MAGRVERHIGCPGSGKTRLILDKLDEARRELRLGVDEVGFCTFTRAGRSEIVARAAGLWGCGEDRLQKDGWFRTAHSIAFRQCEVENGQLLEGKDGAEWISEVLGTRLSPKYDVKSRETTYETADGDQTVPLALRAWDLARNCCESLDDVIRKWASAREPHPDIMEARAIVRKYEIGKKKSGRLDFVDMIAMFGGVGFDSDGNPFERDPVGDVPESLRVIAIDEAQDSSALVDRVCRRLAASPRVERVWIVGDPYQSIHSFAGGDYRLFLSWDAEEYVMPRSYRCPRNIMSLGERCIRAMRYGYRDRKVAHAEHEGKIRQSGCALEAVGDIKADGSTLILGRCVHSLAEYEEILSSSGVPYTWVDKAHSKSFATGMTALWELSHGEAVCSEDFAESISMISYQTGELGKLLRRGEKSAWKSGRRNDLDFVRPTPESLSVAGCEEVLSNMILSDNWLEAIEDRHRRKADGWYAAASKYGLAAANDPPVKLSTVHAAKGLEADRVILSTITSPAVERAKTSRDESHDEECRVAYVAVTRARHDLTVVGDGTNYRMELPL